MTVTRGLVDRCPVCEAAEVNGIEKVKGRSQTVSESGEGATVEQRATG